MKNIIVVDMQKAFMRKTNEHLIEKIDNYLKSNKFDNIFFTKCFNDDSSPYTNILKWNGLKNPCDLDFVIAPPPNTRVIEKNCYGISQDDIVAMKMLNISEIEICGTDVDACVLAISFCLFDNNIKPIILKNLCASSSRNPNIQNHTLEIMARQFGHENVK